MLTKVVYLRMLSIPQLTPTDDRAGMNNMHKFIWYLYNRANGSLLGVLPVYLLVDYVIGFLALSDRNSVFWSQKTRRLLPIYTVQPINTSVYYYLMAYIHHIRMLNLRVCRVITRLVACHAADCFHDPEWPAYYHNHVTPSNEAIQMSKIIPRCKYLDISTKHTPLCLLSSLPSGEINSIPLAILLSKIAYFHGYIPSFFSWYILPAVCFRWKINYISKWADSANNGSR